LISEAISRGVGSAGGVVFSYKLLAAAGLAAAALFSAAAAERHAPGRWAFGFAVVALNPVLLIHTVGGGHNDALVAAGLAAAAFVALSWPAEPMSGRAFAVTALLALTSMVKIVAAIALALWVADLVRRGFRRWAAVASAHLGVALGIGAALSLRYVGGGRVFTSLANLAGRQGWASPARLVARGAEAVGDVISPAWGDALSTLVLAGFLVLFGLALVHIVRAESPSPPARWAMAMVVFALAAPYLLPWYAAWFVALLALVAALPDRRFLAVGIGTALVLALTGIPAEPAAGAAGLWHGMVLAVHYVAAPILLFLLVVALRSVADRPLPRMAGSPAADDEVERSRSS
jgi:alpha-1,6-mannosyltransferase